MRLTDWIAITGLVTGVTGMVLGIVSTVDMLQKKRVSLRVIPKMGHKQGNGMIVTTSNDLDTTGGLMFGKPPNYLAVEIVNLSAFPVTISDVGFGKPNKERLAFIVPEVSLGYTWPAVIESRRAVTVYQSLDKFVVSRQHLARNIYVETECGAVRKGRSAALNWFVRKHISAKEK
jgi:hypothetical protein